MAAGTFYGSGHLDRCISLASDLDLDFIVQYLVRIEARPNDTQRTTPIL